LRVGEGKIIANGKKRTDEKGAFQYFSEDFLP